MARRLLALLLSVALLGCTSGDAPEDPATGSPSPSPSASPADTGDRVAVVVGPSPAAPVGERAAQRAAAEALAELPDVVELRVVEAESLQFAEDLARVLADDGFDLVCVVGTGTAGTLAQVARARPLTRFCGTDPTVEEPPANLVVVGLDLADVAALAGAALGDPGGPVGLLASGATAELEPLALRLAEVLPPLPPPSPSPSPSPGATTSPDATSPPTPSPTSPPGPSPSPSAAASPSPPPSRVLPRPAASGDGAARAVVDELLGLDAAALVVLGGRADAALARAARGRVPVVGLSDWLVDAEGELPSGVLVAVVVDRRAVLLAAAAAARSSPGAEPARLGLDDGVLDVVPGTRRGADAAVERALVLLEPDTD